MSRNIENNLASALAPVRCPDELWSRVEASLPTASRSRPRPASDLWPRLLMAATLAALMSGGVLYLRAQQRTVTSSFATAALGLHQNQAALGAADNGIYAVQRYTVGGEPVTIVSIAATSEPASASSKSVRTAEFANLSVTEWTSEGRRWAMVSSKLSHNQACSVCHRA